MVRWLLRFEVMLLLEGGDWRFLPHFQRSMRRSIASCDGRWTLEHIFQQSLSDFEGLNEVVAG